jgi:C_GCAxxG_C_C family probable redox protein
MNDSNDNQAAGNGHRPTAADEAVEGFCNGCNCSQAVLSVHAERYGIDQATAMRIATGLGGGVGRMGGTCGTLTGAALVLGLEFGPGERGDQAAKDRTYAAASRLQRRFIEQHGSNQCRELLGRDLSIDDEYREAREAGLFKSRCPRFVETAVTLLDEIIRENRKP